MFWKIRTIINNRILRLNTYISALFNGFPHCKINSSARIIGNVKLGRGVWIDRNVQLLGDITIGDNSNIHDNVLIRSFDSKIEIGNNTLINRNSTILVKVKIGSDCLIGPNVVVASSNHIHNSRDIPMNIQGNSLKGIIIEDDVWIGANSTITDGVCLHKGCIVGAGSVVTKDVEEYSIVAGTPAMFIKTRIN